MILPWHDRAAAGGGGTAPDHPHYQASIRSGVTSWRPVRPGALPRRSIPVRRHHELVSARAGGAYAVAASAEPLLTELTREQKELLTSWLANKRGKGNACPLVTAQVINSLPG